jgi:hypothetical protein
MKMFTRGDLVRIKKKARDNYGGAKGGRVVQLTTTGDAVKVLLDRYDSREPAERWIPVDHLEVPQS